MSYISQSRLHDRIREYIKETCSRFESTMRINPNGGDSWVCTEQYLNIIENRMNRLADILAELVLKRAEQRCKDSENVKVIEQDVYDAFDIYKVSLK